MASWSPRLSGSGPLYRRLADAIARDIASGRLAADERLPPQRDLAHALSISVGAVTRAYDEARRRGLVDAHVGRGTFVLDRGRESVAQDGPIDLSVNTGPAVPVEIMLETIAALRRASAWSQRLLYQPPCGHDADRRALAAWLVRMAGLERVDWNSLICCAGAQNAMAVAFAALCRPGDTVLCEAATFPGMKTLAVQQGYRLHGVDMDGQGLRPQALDRAAATTRARVLYTLPTLHNPTARTMDRKRRAEIVRIARARDLLIVEDDLYAPYARHLGLPPLAALAPERTLHVGSLSKILSPGLRSGYLVAPSGDIFDACLRAQRALMHSPSGIGAAIATDWLDSGRADELARAACAEAGARTAMALGALKGRVEAPRGDASLHLWLPMRALDAERVTARALGAGLRLAPHQAFAVADGSISGLRLCLGSTVNRATLARALSILNDALAGRPDAQAGVAL